ncbi:hypothetical protein F8M41_025365 [Gigaspora margarita]|uniref:Uncharacterized protein n=1 Tax=Gigaspora margarita TaxID=4874 RepID=A0A8H3XJF7_GIGMA|nr:hypothetical protein F8M41_025365 [Gigaspora margarita]
MREDIVKDRLIKNLTKRSKQEHASFTSSEQFYETPTTPADVQEIADDSESHYDDSHDDPQHDALQHQHDDPQQEASSAGASSQKGAGHQESQ